MTISGGGAGVTEGGDAVFTITASPGVSQQGGFASSLPSTVTLTGGSATPRVSTVDDGASEPEGSITVALTGGSGYTPRASSAATRRHLGRTTIHRRPPRRGRWTAPTLR